MHQQIQVRYLCRWFIGSSPAPASARHRQWERIPSDSCARRCQSDFGVCSTGSPVGTAIEVFTALGGRPSPVENGVQQRADLGAKHGLKRATPDAQKVRKISDFAISGLLATDQKTRRSNPLSHVTHPKRSFQAGKRFWVPCMLSAVRPRREMCCMRQSHGTHLAYSEGGSAGQSRTALDVLGQPGAKLQSAPGSM